MRPSATATLAERPDRVPRAHPLPPTAVSDEVGPNEKGRMSSSRGQQSHARSRPAARWLRRAVVLVVPLVVLASAVLYAAERVEDDRRPRPRPEPTEVSMAGEEIDVEVAPDPPAERDAHKRRKQRVAVEIGKIEARQADVRRRRLAVAAERAALPSTFRVATFNVLGASHTDAGGNKPGWASSGTRMGWTVAALDDHDIDVVGFQEFETSQANRFSAMTGGRYALFPGTSLGPRSVRFSIAWRTDEWTAVDTSTVGVTYAGGNYIDMPVVRLRRKDTGREVYFINVHNPASTGRLGNNDRWRLTAREIEIDLINRLRAETGLPVIITGDMNEREQSFCPMVQRTDMGAANGGSVGSGPCSPPPAMHVDWIYGTASLITWANYTQSGTGTEGRVSDHDLVFADATVVGEEPPTEGPGPGTPTEGPGPGTPTEDGGGR